MSAGDSTMTPASVSCSPMRIPRLLCLLTLGLALLGSASGCKAFTAYMADRGRDFGEIVRIQIGVGAGLGASAQAGPAAHVGFGLGVIPYDLGVGWVYGEGYAFGANSGQRMDSEIYWPFTWIHIDGDPLGKGLHTGGDGIGQRGVGGHRHVCWNLFPGLIAEEPDAGLMHWTPRGLETDRRGHIHSWDVEAAVYAGFIVARVGFSPGEFLDFILGWFGVDIAQDDTADEERRAFGRGESAEDE